MPQTDAINHRDVIAEIKHWISKVIVGLNFCPFAKKELERDTIRYQVAQTTAIKGALDVLLEELALLDAQQDIQTTLIIFPHGFAEFDDYLDLVDMANVLIAQSGYQGLYQLASFHPHYCFEGEEYSDPANYTNRSPLPILHILRESSVEKALQHYPHPESIPDNNITKARQLGADYLQSLIK